MLIVYFSAFFSDARMLTVNRVPAVVVRPFYPFFAFMDVVRDPGNSLVYSIWSGVMYSGNQPQNYKRSVEL